jgi:hypothetical protein
VSESSFNMSTTLWSCYVCWWGREYMKISVPFAQFFCELKIAVKNKFKKILYLEEFFTNEEVIKIFADK